MAKLPTNNATKALDNLLRTVKGQKEDKEKEVQGYDPTQQAEGLRTRIEGSGLDADKFTDDRNFLGKFLNLTPNQNFLFDVFEVIGRPQQAAFNAIKASQEGRDVKEGLFRGLTGKDEEVWFNEILNNAGVGDPDTFGLDNVLGFVGDIFLDPVDLALIAAAPFSGGASAAVLYVDKTRDTAKGLRKSVTKLSAEVGALKEGTDAFKKVSKTIAKRKKQLEFINKKEPLLKGLRDAAEKLEILKQTPGASKLELSKAKQAYKQSLKPLMVRKSPIDLAFRGSKWAVKNTFKLADTSTVRILSKMDSLRLERLAANDRVGAQAVAEMSDQAKNYLNEGYSNLKSRIKSMVEAVESLPKELISKVSGNEKIAREQMLTLGNDVVKIIEDTAQATGKSVAEVEEIITDLIEFNMKRGKTSINEILTAPPKGGLDQATQQRVLDFIYNKVKSDTGAAYAKSKEELAGRLFEEITMEDGTKRYLLNGEETKQISDFIKKQIDEQKAFFDQHADKINQITKKIEKAQKIDNTTYVIENGQLVWSKAPDATVQRAANQLDDDIVDQFLKDDDLLQDNESIINAIDAQRKKYDDAEKKLKVKIKAAKKRLASAKTQAQIKKINQNIKDLEESLMFAQGRKKPLAETRKQAKQALRRKSQALDPILNPENYNINQLQKSVADKSLETSLFEEIDRPVFYSDADIQELESLKNDPVIGKAANDVKSRFDRSLEILEENLGITFGQDVSEGYVRHVTTEQGRKFLLGKMPDDEFDAAFKGRTKSFSKREWQMSAREANKIYQDMVSSRISNLETKLTEVGRNTEEGKKVLETIEKTKKFKQSRLFETEYSKTFKDFIEEGSSVGKATELFHQFILTDVFDNPELFKPASKEEVLRAKRKGLRSQDVSKKQLRNKVRDLRNFAFKKTQLEYDDIIKIRTKAEAEDLLKDDPLGLMLWRIEKDPLWKEKKRFLMDEGLVRAIGVAKNPEPNIFLDALTFINNSFKQLSLLTPGFQVRNLIGNYANLKLSGINMVEFNGYLSDTVRTLDKGQEVLAKEAREGINALDAAEKLILDDYKRFIRGGFHDIAYELYDLSEESLKGKGPLGKVLRANMDANKYMDNMYRMSLLKYALDNPDSYIRLGLNSPQDFVRQVLFDPNDLTQTEKRWLRNLIPFYTFMKKNLAYQMSNIFENPKEYNEIRKMVESAWTQTGIDQDEIEAYKKENFWIPVFKKEGGEYVAIKANLPIGDLGEFVSDPLQKVISSITPGVRAPFELMTNTQSYTGLPIEQFQGQQGFRIPELNRKAEYLLGQTGLLNPASVVYDTVNMFRQGPSLERLGASMSITSSGSVAREQRNRAYQDLESLRSAVSYYKQEGKEIKTLAEIRSQVSLDKTKTAEILNRLKSTLGN